MRMRDHEKGYIQFIKRCHVYVVHEIVFPNRLVLINAKSCVLPACLPVYMQWLDLPSSHSYFLHTRLGCKKMAKSVVIIGAMNV